MMTTDTFYTRSESLQETINGLNLIKSLQVSALVTGEAHIGKKTLLRYLFPHLPFVPAHDSEALEHTLQTHDEVIVGNIERLRNLDIFEKYDKRILATADYIANERIVEEYFAFIYTVPSLKERKEDVEYLKNKFAEQAAEDLMIPFEHIDSESLPIDLSANSKSLKKGIYEALSIRYMDEEMLYRTLYNHFYDKLEGKNAYKELIGLFEKPLIEAGLKKYGSQLKLAEVLGINRNTLRKKIHEHGID